MHGGWWTRYWRLTQDNDYDVRKIIQADLPIAGIMLDGQTDGQTNRQAGRPTDRQRDRWTGKKKDRLQKDRTT